MCFPSTFFLAHSDSVFPFFFLCSIPFLSLRFFFRFHIIVMQLVALNVAIIFKTVKRFILKNYSCNTGKAIHNGEVQIKNGSRKCGKCDWWSKTRCVCLHQLTIAYHCTISLHHPLLLFFFLFLLFSSTNHWHWHSNQDHFTVNLKHCNV